MFVVDRLQPFGIQIAAGTGVLTANTQATISTATNPVWAALRVAPQLPLPAAPRIIYGRTGSVLALGYHVDSTVGTLGRGQPITITGGQPIGVGCG
jgi:hypothetical protein